MHRIRRHQKRLADLATNGAVQAHSDPVDGEDTTTPGQVCYEAYSHARGGKAFDGSPLLPWDGLDDEIRDGWEVGAVAVLSHFEKVEH